MSMSTHDVVCLPFCYLAGKLFYASLQLVWLFVGLFRKLYKGVSDSRRARQKQENEEKERKLVRIE